MCEQLQRWADARAGLLDLVRHFFTHSAGSSCAFRGRDPMLGAIAGDIIGSPYEARPIKTKDFPP